MWEEEWEEGSEGGGVSAPDLIFSPFSLFFCCCKGHITRSLHLPLTSSEAGVTEQFSHVLCIDAPPSSPSPPEASGNDSFMGLIYNGKHIWDET